MYRNLLALGCVLLAADLLPAADDDTEPLRLSAAAFPSPALRYHLLPAAATEQPGDALPIYTAATTELIRLLQEASTEPASYPVIDWLNTPIEELPRDAVGKYLAKFKDLLERVDKAARCRDCVSTSAAGNDLPSSYFVSRLIMLVALRAKLQIAERDFPGALNSLQTALGIVRHMIHLGLQPVVFDGEIETILLKQLEAFVSQSGAPNLYFALSEFCTFRHLVILASPIAAGGG